MFYQHCLAGCWSHLTNNSPMGIYLFYYAEKLQKQDIYSDLGVSMYIVSLRLKGKPIASKEYDHQVSQELKNSRC